MHNRQDITETNLKPALLEGKESTTLNILRFDGFGVCVIQLLSSCISRQHPVFLPGDTSRDVQETPEPTGCGPGAESEGQTGHVG